MDKTKKLLEQFIGWHSEQGADAKLNPESAQALSMAVIGKTVAELCEIIEKHGGLEKVLGRLLGGGCQQGRIGFLAGHDDTDDEDDMNMRFPGEPPKVEGARRGRRGGRGRPRSEIAEYDEMDELYDDEPESRRGVPGTGPYGDPRKRGRRRRSPRYEHEDENNMRYELREEARKAARDEVRSEHSRRAEIEAAYERGTADAAMRTHEAYETMPHNVHPGGVPVNTVGPLNRRQ